MKKYMLLRFGRCYLNREGDFVIALLRGDKSHGYEFAASHAHSSVWLGRIYIRSRVVLDDGNWIEVDPSVFNAASALHIHGNVLRLPDRYTGKEPLAVSKKY